MGYLPRQEALQKIISGVLQAFPLEFELTDVDGNIGPRDYDWVLEADWKGIQERFVVAYQRRATPKKLLNAIWRLSDLIEEADEKLRPLIMVPYLDSETLDYLEEKEMNGIDLCGNGVIDIPGQWYIRESGNPDLYPENTPIKNVFRGKSGLVPRLFLTEPRFKTVNAVVDAIEDRGVSISQSTVSRVLKRLDELLLIERSGIIRVLNADALLDNLVENYEVPDITQQVEGKLPDTSTPLKDILRVAKEQEISVAGSSSEPYAVMATSDDVTDIFVSSLDPLLSALRAAGCQFEEDKRFPTLRLSETDDPAVFFDSRSRDQFVWTSPVQTYLELSQGDKRERETAEQIRDNIVIEVDKRLEVN